MRLFLICCWLLLTSLGFANDELDLTPVDYHKTDATEPPELQVLTTRPTFTDSWLAIPKGSFQFESGLSYTQVNDDKNSTTLPEALFKLGVDQNLEFRIAAPSYFLNQNNATDIDNQNWGDLQIGLSKHVAFSQQKLDLAIIPLLNLPTGANTVSSNTIDPELRVVLAKTINPKLTVATQQALRYFTAGDKRLLWNPTLIAYYALHPKWSIFSEWAGIISTQDTFESYVQGGLLYYPHPRHQLDIRVGKGIGGDANNYFVGFGYSFRLDKLF